MKKEKQKLKIYIHTNEEINKNFLHNFCECVAQTIFESKEVQELIHKAKPAV